MNRRKIGISTLTIWASLFCLAGFLFYWNISNYQNAKKQLEEDLDVQMELAVAAYNDTLMVQIFNFEPFDSLFDASVRVLFNDADVPEDTLPGLTSENGANLERHSEVVSVSISSISEDGNSFDSTSRENVITDLRRIEVRRDGDTSDISAFVKGVTIDSLNYSGKRVTTNSIVFDKTNSKMTPDITGAFKVIIEDRWSHILDYFDKKLIENSLPNIYTEVDSSYDVSSGEIRVAPKNTRNVATPKAIIFADFKFYLFKQLITSFFISLLLFTLVGLSFWLMRRNALEQLKLASIKNEFIANVTHELKTPISTVGVALESLKQYGGIQDPVKTNEYIDISQRELSRLQLLIDKVLKMSALEEDIAFVQLTSVDMQKVVSDVIDSLQLYLDQYGVSLSVTQHGENYNVDGDAVHLTNVIYNLVDNAVKYRGADPKVEVLMTEQSTNITIAIKDNGIGIPTAYQSKVFDRFFRVPKGDVHTAKGHGLGLNYTKSVVEKLGGQVSLESVLDQGTTFIITLPKKQL